MRQAQLMSKERLIYWPGEFAEIMDLLTGKDKHGGRLPIAMYEFNTQAIVLAACIGVAEGRKRDIGSSTKKEISTVTMAGHGLERFIFLIPQLAEPDKAVDILRTSNEELAIREFERYAAGGLEVLAGAIERSPLSSIDAIVAQLVKAQDTPSTGAPEDEEMPDLME